MPYYPYLLGVNPAPEDPSVAEPLLGVSRYTKVRDLGRGRFGLVQLAQDNFTQQLLAVKCIRPKPGFDRCAYGSDVGCLEVHTV